MKGELVVGDLKFEAIAKEFYCRHCDQYTPHCHKQHRSGIWFLVKVTNTKKRNKTYFVVGEGDTEKRVPWINYGNVVYSGMSGCCEYQNAYITCGGWHYLTTVPCFDIVIPEEELKDPKAIELTKFEKTILTKLLDESRLSIVIELFKQKVIDYSTDLGLWETTRPLLITWDSSKTIDLPLNAWLSWRHQSWIADFHFGKITITTIKAKPNIQEYKGIYYIDLGRHRTIAYTEVFGRRIAYYKIHNRIIGFEEYQDYYHSPCELDLNIKYNYELHEIMDLLVYNRLGDVLFLTLGDCEVIKNYTWFRLQPAEKQHFNKIKCIKGCIEFCEPIKVFSDSKIVLYHDEHGLLELPKGEYVAYQVPYLRRGHE